MATYKDLLGAAYQKLDDGDPSAWVAALDDEVLLRVHGPAPHAGEIKGKEALLELMGEITPTRDDEKLVPELFVEDGDELVVLGTESWTYVPTGKSTEARFAHHYTFRQGRIVLFEDFEPAGADVY